MLDTNVLVSALLVPTGPPGTIYRAWADGAFTLLVSRELIAELRRTLAKPALTIHIRPHHAGHLVNALRKLAQDVHPLPRVQRSSDSDDDFLLGMAEGGNADYLVTGDKSGLLALRRHKGTRIVSAREFVNLTQ